MVWSWFCFRTKLNYTVDLMLALQNKKERGNYTYEKYAL